MQRELEGISESLRIPGNKSLGPVARVRTTPRLARKILMCVGSLSSAVYVQAFRKSESILGNNKQTLIADFAPDKKVILLQVSLQPRLAKCRDLQ